MSEQTVEISIVCVNLPGRKFGALDGVRLGVQKGTEVIEDVSGDAKTVTFLCPLRIGNARGKSAPNFLGPYSQGKVGERFIYLSWGDRMHGIWAQFRRAKLMLNHLTWDNIEKSISTGEPIEVIVQMTDRKGEPVCATLRADNIEWRL